MRRRAVATNFLLLNAHNPDEKQVSKLPHWTYHPLVTSNKYFKMIENLVKGRVDMLGVLKMHIRGTGMSEG